MHGGECGGKWGWWTKGGSPLEESQCIARLESEWGTLLGSKVTPCLFGREFFWFGNLKALVWEVRREG